MDTDHRSTSLLVLLQNPVFFIAATVFGSLQMLERRFRGPGKLAAGRADVCPPMALNASQPATPSAPTADVQSAAGCDDQQ